MRSFTKKTCGAAVKRSAECIGIWLLLLVSTLVFRDPAYGREPQADLKRVLTEWDRRRAGTRTVRYEITGQVMIPKGRHNDSVESTAGKEDLPSEDYVYDKAMTIILDFENNRFRREVRDQIFHGGDLRRFHPQYIIRTFDGTTFKSFTPREENTGNGYTPDQSMSDLYLGGKDLVKYAVIFFTWDEFPVFLAHGILTTAPDPRRGFRATLDPGRIHVQGYAVQDGGERVVLRGCSK